jgi:mono/diheme cytochrome c family protein
MDEPRRDARLGTSLAGQTGMMRTSILCALSLLAALPAFAGADEHPGRAVYLRYCGACHGPGGKGDGIAGTFMTPKPKDLTRIAAENGGKFPFQEVMADIDGTDSVRAHGDPDMPVWGEVFRDHSTWDPARRTDVRSKLTAITDYLRSIQEDGR